MFGTLVYIILMQYGTKMTCGITIIHAFWIKILLEGDFAQGGILSPSSLFQVTLEGKRKRKRGKKFITF